MLIPVFTIYTSRVRNHGPEHVSMRPLAPEDTRQQHCHKDMLSADFLLHQDRKAGGQARL